MASTSLPDGAAYTGATAESMAVEQSKYGAPSVFNPKTAVAKGRMKVANHRKPFRLWYEVHGDGPQKILFIMGLDGTSWSWLHQVEHFASQPQYSCLVFDNRGYGNSESPRTRYTSKSLAEDVVALLDHVEWKGRCVNVVGVSMGGMIALELAQLVSERILSLTLMSTMASLRYPSPINSLLTMQRIGVGRSLQWLDSDEAQMESLISISFPRRWLDATSDSDAQGRTNREVMREIMVWRSKAVPKPTSLGSLSYTMAVSTHKVSSASLAKINEAIPRITILTGDCDDILNPQHSEYMAQYMPRANLTIFANNGHAIQMQSPDELSNLLSETFKAGMDAAVQ